MTLRGTLTSRENPKVKHARSLLQKRARYREGLYLVEGLRLVTQALDAGAVPVSAFYAEVLAESSRGAALLERLGDLPTPTWCLPQPLLARLSDTVTPPEIVAVLSMPPAQPEAARSATLVLVLDAIRDPGNLGSILRTAHAAGVGAVLLAPGCADPFAPKTVRGGMGAQVALSLVPVASWSEAAHLTEGKTRLLADAAAKATLWDVDWRPPTALIIGGEAEGAGPEARALADVAVSLPMEPGIESLNAAAAAAAMLYEARRQRRGRQPNAA